LQQEVKDKTMKLMRKTQHLRNDQIKTKLKDANQAVNNHSKGPKNHPKK
jgi:hypothetical protein